MGRSMGDSQLLLLIISYYAASTLTSCLTKSILEAFPRPVTVSLVQQTMASAGALIRVGSLGGALREWRAALPVAFTLLASVVLYRISLVHNSLSFAQAVKTLQPLFVSLLSAVLLRERSSPRRVFALLVLLCGVSIATSTELSFSMLGFLCTLGSCFAQALQQVLSKSLVVHNRIGEEHLFACAALYTTAMLLPLWLVTDAGPLLRAEAPQLAGSGAIVLLFFNGLCNFAAQRLSFAVLCAVASPVSAAVVSTFKRVVVIVAAVVWFRTPITLPHALGVAVAITGVALFRERRRTAESATPYVAFGAPSLAANPRTRRNRNACYGAV
jgi:solute carrier family 35 protein E1